MSVRTEIVSATPRRMSLSEDLQLLLRSQRFSFTVKSRRTITPVLLLPKLDGLSELVRFLWSSEVSDAPSPLSKLKLTS